MDGLLRLLLLLLYVICEILLVRGPPRLVEVLLLALAVGMSR